MTVTELTIGLVAHHVFCPRRAWLEAHGEKTDTAQMATGLARHSTADDPSTGRPSRLRSVEVGSRRLGLTGRCDSIERDPLTGNIVLVEHKANPVRRRSQATDAQQVQLALQAMCLREQGHDVAGASVWFTETRQRVEVEVTRDLEEAALTALRDTRRNLARSRPPPPLDDDARCRWCSHVSVCLPDEHRERPDARRIGVADPLGQVLHLTTPGSRASLRRGRIEVRALDQETVQVPLGQVASIVVHGNVDVSSGLMREVLERDLPVVWCSWTGRVVGWATGAGGPNGEARSAQHRLGVGQCLSIARMMIEGKLRNERYVLRRHRLPGRDELATLVRRAAAAPTTAALFGIEGAAAAAYFRVLARAFKPAWAEFSGRHGRPARDQVNAALNVAYSLLLADVLRAVVACGLDPHGGVLHSPGRNKPALALDLMEEFRPLVAEAAVLWAFNNGELGKGDFRTDLDAVRMTPAGRKALIATYERRVRSEFRHPLFGYRVTWRRAMEIQARMFLAVVTGERNVYRPITLR